MNKLKKIANFSQTRDAAAVADAITARVEGGAQFVTHKLIQAPALRNSVA
jgi:hypothetical protein